MTSSTTTITVYGNLTAGAIGNAQTICYNTVPGQLSYTTAPTGGTGAYTYQWYNTSGQISGATSSTYTPPALTSNTNLLLCSNEWFMRNIKQQYYNNNGLWKFNIRCDRECTNYML